MSQLISHARITEMPQELAGPMPMVKVRVDGGEEFDLFSFYPDELSVDAEEFIGLTPEEGLRLRHAKDVAYLRC